MKVKLQVKCVSLGDEIRYIHKKEHQAKAQYRWARKHNKPGQEQRKFWELREHRVWLSEMVRNAFVAYAFLRGKSYDEVEGSSRSHPNWDTVRNNIVKFHGENAPLSDNELGHLLGEFEVWATEARQRIDERIVQYNMDQRKRENRRKERRAAKEAA